jgi:hypothetical protein
MTAEAALQLLGSAGLAAVLVAVINAVVNRRKLGAEATKMISDAAAGAVKDARDDNVRLRAENSEFRARVTALEDRQEEREGEWEAGAHASGAGSCRSTPRGTSWRSSASPGGSRPSTCPTLRR